MSTTLAESSSWSSTITVPEDGDLMSASSVNTPIGTLANRTQRIKDGVFTYLHPLMLVSAGNWQNQANNLRQSATGTSYGYLMEVPFFIGTLTGITWEGMAGSGHGGTLPTTVAGISVLTRSSLAEAISVATTIADDSASAAAYETTHEVSSGALSYDLSAQRYWLAVRPENGGSAVTGYEIGWIRVTVTP